MGSSAAGILLTDMPIEKQLFRNLKNAYDLLHIELFKLFKKFEITVAQFDLMETILFSPNRALSIRELASSTVSLQPNITRAVAILEKSGLVRRTKSQTDRRTVIVGLTSKGERLLARIQPPLLDLHIAQFGKFSADELRIFNKLARKTSRFQKKTEKGEL